MLLAAASTTAQPGSEAAAQLPAQTETMASPDPLELAREWNAERRARETWQDEAQALSARIQSGEAEPEEEARRAASLGRWAMMTGTTAIPFGVHFALGVECRPNSGLFTFGRLQLLHGQGSDVIRAAEEMQGESQSLARFRVFALRYNRALIAAPAFPLRDLCRPAADDYRPLHHENLAPESWGFRDLRETDAPIDLYEAARRGSPASLRRLLHERPRQMHIPDLLGMTPLAWAVAYDRPKQVRLLLRAGAHPYGGPWQNQPEETSPITLALTLRNRALVALMRPELVRLGLPMPATPPLLDARRSQLDRMVLEQPVYGGPLRYLLGTRFEVSAEGRVLDCRFPVGDALQGPYRPLCARARRWLTFLPAEDGDGRPIAGSVYLRRLPPGQIGER